MTHLFFDILILLLLVLLVIGIFLKQRKLNRFSSKIYNFLDRHSVSINKLNRSDAALKLKHTIYAYSKFQMIQKISGSDFVSLIICDYDDDNNTNINFLFSIDKEFKVIKKSLFDDVKINCESLVNNILLNKQDIELMNLEELKNTDRNLYDSIKRCNINKIYYKTIYSDNVLRYVMLIAYKDSYLQDDDKEEIIRILKEEEKNILNIGCCPRDSIIEEQKDINELKKVFRRNKKRIFITKTFIFFVFMFMLFFIYDSFRMDSYRVFDLYYEPQPTIVTRGSSQEQELTKIYVLYGKEKYEEASIKFDEYFSKYGYNNYTSFYAGLSALFDKFPDKALYYFDKVDYDSVYRDGVEWYKAGCYLLKDDIDSAKELLTKISNTPNHDYRDLASEILKKLKLRD